MGKGIIVVDVPETCENCLFSMVHAAPLQDCLYCTVLTMGVMHKSQIKRPDWCPIKLMPERKQIPDSFFMMDEVYGKEIGFNDCLDEIEGKMQSD